MFQNEKVNLEDDKLKKNISTMFALQPMIGLILSVITAFFALIKGREWSIMLLLFTFFPFFICCLLCFIEYIGLRRSLSFRPILFRKKYKYITIIFVVALVVLEIMIFKFNSKMDIPTISLEKTEEMINKKDNFYIIFGAQNCLYCKDMEDIYKSTFNEVEVENVYYCDISYESYDNKTLKTLGVDKLPMLFKIHKGKVINQMVGKREYEDIEHFFKEE